MKSFEYDPTIADIVTHPIVGDIEFVGSRKCDGVVWNPMEDREVTQTISFCLDAFIGVGRQVSFAYGRSLEEAKDKLLVQIEKDFNFDILDSCYKKNSILYIRGTQYVTTVADVLRTAGFDSLEEVFEGDFEAIQFFFRTLLVRHERSCFTTEDKSSIILLKNDILDRGDHRKIPHLQKAINDEYNTLYRIREINK